jgi:nickel-dependent lactate racemase
VRSVRVPWAAWYGDGRHHGHFELTFPDGWDVAAFHMRGGADIGDAGIRAALAAPVGAPRLRDVARGRRTAAILIDDLSRPTPSWRLLPYVLEELAAGGIGEDHVRIIAALAAHRPMTRGDFVKKVGLEIVERMQVCNHDAYENLEFLGYSSRGVPVFVNRDYMACEVRIALGMITPRGGFFGGGAKLLIPGACGQPTIMANHRYIREGFREHLDEVARLAGLQYIVNPLLGEELEVIGLVAGEPAAAFARGVEMGRELYRTPVPERPVDVGIFNAFPKDTELLQAPLALVPMHGHAEMLAPDASVVIASASPEGLGWHSVLGPGTQLAGRPSARKGTIVFSPGCNRWDVRAKFGEEALHRRTWAEVVAELGRRHGDRPRVAVFPAGALQYTGA